MSNKETALRSIAEIQSAIENSFITTSAYRYFFAIGSAIISIPVMEYFFSHTIDPLIVAGFPGYSGIVAPTIFILRTVWYWLLFSHIAHRLEDTNKNQHPFIKKLFYSFTFYPLIPISTGAALASIGQTALISPVILIIIGSLHVVVAPFMPKITGTVAWSWVIMGIVGIILTPNHIPYLWQSLVIFQGLGIIAIGINARNMNNTKD